MVGNWIKPLMALFHWRTGTKPYASVKVLLGLEGDSDVKLKRRLFTVHTVHIITVCLFPLACLRESLSYVSIIKC